MTVHTLEISQPDKWLNANQRLHWATRSQRTRAWRYAASYAARQADLPKHLPNAHILITLGFPDARRRDVGNLQPTAKALVDGLIDYGLLVDDSDEYLTGPDLRRGPKTTTGRGLIVLTVTTQETP